MALLFSKSNCNVVIKRGAQEFSAQNPGELGSAFFNSIMSAHVTQQCDVGGQVEVVIEPAFADAIKILKSGLLGTGYRGDAVKPKPPVTGEEIQNTIKDALELKIQLTFEYPGETLADGSPARSKTYIAQSQAPKVSIRNNNVTITLIGYGVIWNLKGNTVAKKLKGKPLSIIEDLMNELDIDLYVTDEAEQVLNSADVIDQTFSGDYLEIIKTILRNQKEKLYLQDCVSKDGGSQITITKDDSDKGSKAKYACVLFNDINTSKNIIPIYDFNAESNFLFMPNQPFGIYSPGVNTSTKKMTTPETNSINKDAPKQAPTKGTGNRVPAFIRKGGNNGEAPADSRTELANMSQGTSNYVEPFNITIPGIPDLLPRDKVNIKIADGIPAYDGDFLVISITHNWSDSVWISELQLGFPKALGREEAPPSTKINAGSSNKNTKQGLPL